MTRSGALRLIYQLIVMILQLTMAHQFAKLVRCFKCDLLSKKVLCQSHRKDNTRHTIAPPSIAPSLIAHTLATDITVYQVHMHSGRKVACRGFNKCIKTKPLVTLFSWVLRGGYEQLSIDHRDYRACPMAVIPSQGCLSWVLTP